MKLQIVYSSGPALMFSVPLTSELISLSRLSKALTDHRGVPSIEILEIAR